MLVVDEPYEALDREAAEMLYPQTVKWHKH